MARNSNKFQLADLHANVDETVSCWCREVKAQPVITLRPGVVELDISPRRV